MQRKILPLGPPFPLGDPWVVTRPVPSYLPHPTPPHPTPPHPTPTVDLHLLKLWSFPDGVLFIYLKSMKSERVNMFEFRIINLSLQFEFKFEYEKCYCCTLSRVINEALLVASAVLFFVFAASSRHFYLVVH